MENEMVFEIGEICNKIVTDQNGTKIFIDKEDLEGLIEMLGNILEGRDEL